MAATVRIEGIPDGTSATAHEFVEGYTRPDQGPEADSGTASGGAVTFSTLSTPGRYVAVAEWSTDPASQNRPQRFAEGAWASSPAATETVRRVVHFTVPA